MNSLGFDVEQVAVYYALLSLCAELAWFAFCRSFEGSSGCVFDCFASGCHFAQELVHCQYVVVVVYSTLALCLWCVKADMQRLLTVLALEFCVGVAVLQIARLLPTLFLAVCTKGLPYPSKKTAVGHSIRVCDVIRSNVWSCVSKTAAALFAGQRLLFVIH